MNAKTRYRKRLRLRAALVRVMEVLADNVRDGIPPDRTTAEMGMSFLITWAVFCESAGVAWVPDRSDLARFVKQKIDRQKETEARYRRKRRAARSLRRP